MITIFHGDNPTASRIKYLDFIDQSRNYELLHIDSKSVDLDKLNNFINGGSLLPGKKILAIDNFFSIPKTNLDKMLKFLKNTVIDIVIWQDKLLNVSQLKFFPKSNVYHYNSDKIIQKCLISIKPHNLTNFNTLYNQLIKQDLFDLFLWYLKNHFRKQLLTNAIFSQKILKKIYLQIIELEFQYKSGQLPLSKEVALMRVIIPLIR